MRAGYFYPTSLCGVLVFGSVSRRLRLLRVLLPPPPPLTHNLSLTHLGPHTTCPHTTCPHTTCPHTTCSHTTCPHTTCPYTTCPHTQLVHTQLVHTQLVHTQLVLTQLVHTQLVAHTHTSRTTYHHTTYSHLLFHTHNLLHTNPSPSLFSFLHSPCHLYLSFAACWKKVTCGVIRSFNFDAYFFDTCLVPVVPWGIEGIVFS